MVRKYLLNLKITDDFLEALVALMITIHVTGANVEMKYEDDGDKDKDDFNRPTSQLTSN